MSEERATLKSMEYIPNEFKQIVQAKLFVPGGFIKVTLDKDAENYATSRLEESYNIGQGLTAAQQMFSILKSKITKVTVNVQEPSLTHKYNFKKLEFYSPKDVDVKGNLVNVTLTLVSEEYGVGSLNLFTVGMGEGVIIPGQVKFFPSFIFEQDTCGA